MTSSAIKVPYVNLAAQHRRIKDQLLAAVERVLDTGDFILGEAVETFEHRFAKLCAVRFAVGVNSGTDALVMSLRALGIGPGHEVITVPNSFVASASSIAITGATPVFVDVCDDYNLDVSLLEQAITPRTRAILPVHLTGRPAQMDAILDFARKHDLPVVEDCAQAVTAEYRGQPVGSFGTLGCFSLHPLKTLNACGDGGIITTNDENLAGQLKIMRNIGLASRADCVMFSGNSRLDTLQAAMLLVKLDYLSQWTEAEANARSYQTQLSGHDGIIVPSDKPHERAVYHTFVIQSDRRDELRDYLSKRQIETAIHYPIPIHLQTAFRDLKYGPGSLPVTERLAGRILSLPVHPELSAEQISYTIASILEFYKS